MYIYIHIYFYVCKHIDVWMSHCIHTFREHGHRLGRSPAPIVPSRGSQLSQLLSSRWPSLDSCAVSLSITGKSGDAGTYQFSFFLSSSKSLPHTWRRMHLVKNSPVNAQWPEYFSAWQMANWSTSKNMELYFGNLVLINSVFWNFNKRWTGLIQLRLAVVYGALSTLPPSPDPPQTPRRFRHIPLYRGFTPFLNLSSSLVLHRGCCVWIYLLQMTTQYILTPHSWHWSGRHWI